MTRKGKIQPSTDVTLTDIGNAAGVSVSIVSRVLRNRKDRIPEATREKVREAAEKLGYRRNLLIRGVQTGKSMNIGVIMSQTGSFTSQVTQGIHDELMDEDYCMLLASVPQTSDLSPKSLRRRLVLSLLDRRADGIILRPSTTKVSEVYYTEVLKRDLPLITVDRRLPDLETDFSGTDDELGGRLAARELIEAGHREIAYLSTDSPFSPGKLRREGFEKECAESEGVRSRIVQLAEKEGDLAEEAIGKILKSKKRPTAIGMHADYLILPVQRAASKLSLRIPEDLSVIGYGNLPQCDVTIPTLSSIDQNPYEMGRTAARMLLKRIEDKEGGPITELTEPKLVRRQSVCSPNC